MRIAPWLLAFSLFYPFCAAAGDSTPADPAAPGDCAERPPVICGPRQEPPGRSIIISSEHTVVLRPHVAHDAKDRLGFARLSAMGGLHDL